MLVRLACRGTLLAQPPLKIHKQRIRDKRQLAILICGDKQFTNYVSRDRYGEKIITMMMTRPKDVS